MSVLVRAEIVFAWVQLKMRLALARTRPTFIAPTRHPIVKDLATMNAISARSPVPILSPTPNAVSDASL